MARASEELNRFLDLYRRYAREILTPTIHDIRALFSKWMDSNYWGQKTPQSRLPSPSPIHHRWSRIKRPESVVDKILRKRSEFPAELSLSSVEHMNDAVAGRVAVYFLSNLPLLHKEIRESEDLEISSECPPIAYLSQDLLDRLGLEGLQSRSKESGYVSIHYIVRFRGGRLPLEKRPWWELQVRTITEHVWAEIHHLLGYKPDKRTSFAVTKTFQIISSQLSAIDEHFNLLFDELTRFQRETENIRDADPLNAENLPPVLNGLSIGCAQREIDGLLRLLNSRGLSTVGSLRAVGSVANLEMIRNTFWTDRGRQPGNFEIVACLAAIANLTAADDIRHAVVTQMKFLDAWEELRRLMETPP